MTDFVSWLENEISGREWTQADFARKSGLTEAQVSRVLSRRQNPGQVFYQGVARAFSVPIEEVYRRAGLLPKETLKDAYIRRIEDKLSKITDEKDRQIIEQLIDAMSPDVVVHRRRET